MPIFELRQLIYVSRLVRPLSGAEERLLLGVSQRNNRQRDLTGLIVRSGPQFLQVLEGLAENLQPVMERIRCDPRHTSIRVLSDRSVAKRRFAQWSMAYVTSDAVAGEMSSLASDPVTPEAAIDDLLDRILKTTVPLF